MFYSVVMPAQRLVFVVTLLQTSIAGAQGDRCVDVFEVVSAASPMMDDSGFINLFSRPAERVTETPAPAAPSALPVLRELSQQGRSSVRRGEWPESIRQQFGGLRDLSLMELRRHSAEQNIEILMAHARWNLLLPTRLASRMQDVLLEQLPQWRDRDFRQFADFRKLSPQRFRHAFFRSYRDQVLQNFHQFSVNTRLEILGAELFRSGRWRTPELNHLMGETALALQATPQTLRFKPLKELYRGMVYWRSVQPTMFFESQVRLERLLNMHLNRAGVSLDQGGTSGATNPARPFGPSFYSLLRRLDEQFPGQEKVFEAMDSRTPGFFDPVDVYYPGLRLVVEWDGPIHYFRRMDASDRLDPLTMELRPMDQIKDATLRRMGISVLRWSRPMNPMVETVNLPELIRQQNPGIWE